MKDLVDERYSDEEEPKGKKSQKAAKAEKPKKPIYRKWWFWVLVVLVVIAAFPSGNKDSAPAPATVPSVESTPAVAETSSSADAIVISYDQVGEYGEEKTLNANTDMPTSFIAFNIPGGVYDVTKRAAEGSVQVTVYSGVEFDGQWEQFVSDNCDAPIVLFTGETKPLTIQDGQFVKLSDGGNNVQFVKTGDAPAQQIPAETSDNFIDDHSNEIVAAAKLALDNFISGYDMSLAPQRWTLAKFDDQGAVIGMTKITYNNQVGDYIYVGTLNFDDSGKVVSATPHYLEVQGNLLGDDGYCTDVFDKIKALTN